MKNYEALSKIIREVVGRVAPGVALLDLDKYANERITYYGMESADYMYHPEFAPRPFPGHICTSVNHVICHGIPDEYILAEGDLVNIDIGIRDQEGMYADSAMSVPVGRVARKDEKLLRYGKRVLYAGIEAIREGAEIWQISEAMYKAGLRYGYTTNRAYCGHYIGSEMHLKPSIPAYFTNVENMRKFFPGVLKAGDVLCLEPMTTYGRDAVGVVNPQDGWSVWTRDRANTVMFEHMIRVEKDGATVLTSHFDEDIYERGYNFESAA